MTMKATYNSFSTCYSVTVWEFFVFPSSAFAMHCDNRPDTDYVVQKGWGASVSSATVSVQGSSPAQRSFDLLSLLC